MDPATFEMLDELQAMLRWVFRTTDELTYPVSGTGTAGMEAALANVLEPGDLALVVVGGAFAERMRDIAVRCGVEVATVGGRWAEPVALEEIEAALRAHPQAKAVCAVHAETSTGLRQPLEKIGGLCRESGVLFVVDAVASLGGIEVDVDGWGIDVCYSGSQKCLSAPPGLAPITFSSRAVEAMERRARPPASFYLDALLMRGYVGPEHVYHHTVPISLWYGLHEALRIVLEEGLSARWGRHEQIGAELANALEERGFQPVPAEGFRLPQLACVRLPEGFEDLPNRRRLLDEHGIEVGGGLGQFAGKVWRVGVMGESCNRDYVMSLLRAIDGLL